MLRRLAITAPAVACVVLAAATPSGATSSIAVAGSALPTSTVLIPRLAGGNVILEGTGTHAWSGGLTGTSTINVHFVEHPTGTITYQAFITFTGTTPCGAGTVYLASSGSGPLPGPISGQATTTREADATVPMHADLDVVLFLTPAGAAASYEGDVHCG